jgi:hypothetical protein
MIAAAGYLMTRRTAIGTGLVAMSLGTVAGAAIRSAERPFGALLVDENAVLPDQLTAFVKLQSRTIPVVSVRLDAAGYAGVKRAFTRYQSVLGISCGSTLFCLERIAWDHGLRLTGRSEHCRDNQDNDACRSDLAAMLGGMQPSAGGASSGVRAYQPSRVDGTLHIWSLRKSTVALPRHRGLEAGS